MFLSLKTKTFLFAIATAINVYVANESTQNVSRLLLETAKPSDSVTTFYCIKEIRRSIAAAVKDKVSHTRNKVVNCETKGAGLGVYRFNSEGLTESAMVYQGINTATFRFGILEILHVILSIALSE